MYSRVSIEHVIKGEHVFRFCIVEESMYGQYFAGHILSHIPYISTCGFQHVPSHSLWGDPKCAPAYMDDAFHLPGIHTVDLVSRLESRLLRTVQGKQHMEIKQSSSTIETNVTLTF